MVSPAQTPQPPYFAVIFTSVRTDDDDDYGETAKHMLELASEQPDFLGFESARQEIGISVSYWASQEAITAWKGNIIHRQAQSRAKDWYRVFRVRVCRVEREYGFRVTAQPRIREGRGKSGALLDVSVGHKENSHA
ncbi:MAG: hypothetical protein OHK0026_09590 [Rhodocyclaceae bacterium]